MDQYLLNAHACLDQHGCKPTMPQEGRFKARCPLPGHGKGRGDRNPSLSVFLNDAGTVSLHCHAGCDPRAIMDRLGLTWSELGGRERKQDSDIVKTYDYYSAEGVLLFQVVRKQGKKFIQRRPGDRDGEWIYNLKTIEPIPYHLPRILTEVDKPVYIVEGEKDADTLNALGLLATTAPMGAGKWRKAFNKYFHNRHVIVLRDADEPGRKHQQDVASNLANVALSVRQVPPFPGAKDVSEWVSKNLATKEDLLAFTEQGDVIKKPKDSSSPMDSVMTDAVKSHGMELIRGDALFKKVLPQPVWVVPGLLCEGLAILAGKPKSGKSWMSMAIAMAVAGGREALGLSESEPGKVLVLSLEDSLRRVQDRMKAIAGEDLDPKTLANLDVFVGQPPTLAQIGLWLAKNHGKARLVIIDTLGRWREPQDRNTSLYEHDTNSADAIQRLALQHRVSVLLIHHTRKAEDPNDPLVDISGSFGLSGVADTLMVMRKKRGSPLAELFITGRDLDEARHHLKFQPSLDPAHPRRYAGWVIVSDPANVEDWMSSPRQEILEILRKEGKPMKGGEIATLVGKSRQTVHDMLQKMLAEGLVAKPERGVYTLAGQAYSTTTGQLAE